MGAVWMRLFSELRIRWRAWLGLALVIGLLLLVVGGALTGIGKALPQSPPLAFARTAAYPLALAAFGFYLPAERKRLRRLLPAHN